MPQLILRVAGLSAGIGSLVSVNADYSSRNLGILMAAIALVGFLAACIWRMAHPRADRGPSPE